MQITDNTALLLIGFQNDYFATDGVLQCALEDRAGVDHCLINSQLLIEGFLNAGRLVVAAPIQFQAGYPELEAPVGILRTIVETGAFQAGRSGSEMIPEHARFGDRVIRVPGRHGLNAFFGTELNPVLAGHDVKEGGGDLWCCHLPVRGFHGPVRSRARIRGHDRGRRHRRANRLRAGVLHPFRVSDVFQRPQERRDSWMMDIEDNLHMQIHHRLMEELA